MAAVDRRKQQYRRGFFFEVATIFLLRQDPPNVSGFENNLMVEGARLVRGTMKKGKVSFGRGVGVSVRWLKKKMRKPQA